MGRPEKPVDRTVPECAKLADFLRGLKAGAGLTYEQMAKKTNGLPSKATLERAASGACVPAWDTVAAFITATLTAETWLMNDTEPMVRARDLWIRARRATRAPYYIHKAPNPALISTPADLSRALRRQHIWAGYPSPGEMERMSEPGELPASTTRRIINGDILPIDPTQTIAFLKACDVLERADLASWLDAAMRALKHDSASRGMHISRWFRAKDLLPPEEERFDELFAYREKKERERAA
jgi:hypothetical protein